MLEFLCFGTDVFLASFVCAIHMYVDVSCFKLNCLLLLLLLFFFLLVVFVYWPSITDFVVFRCVCVFIVCFTISNFSATS